MIINKCKEYNFNAGELIGLNSVIARCNYLRTIHRLNIPHSINTNYRVIILLADFTRAAHKWK